MHLLEEKGPLRLGSAFGDTFIEGCVEVSLFQHRIYNIDGCVAILVVVLLIVTLLLHESCVFDALFAQAELQHLDPADEILVNVLLRLQLAFQLRDLRCHLAFFKEPFSLFCEVCPLHIFQRCDNLVKLDCFPSGRRIGPSEGRIFIAKIVRHILSNVLCLSLNFNYSKFFHK